MKVHAVMASHNRAALTVRMLDSLHRATSMLDIEVVVTLFDDGSTDGTAQAAAAIFPQITVLHGDGSAYWAKAMSFAESYVIEHDASCDWVVWLNDDVVLDFDSFDRILPVMRDRAHSVLVGAMRDPHDGRVTYSGFTSKVSRHPLHFDQVTPSCSVTAIDTFNGNFVLVPNRIVHEVGGIDGNYPHALADLDYGLRCRKAGFEVALLPDYVGTCERNHSRSSHRLMGRWRAFTGIKGGGNPKGLARFMRRHGGRDWWIYFTSTYVIWWLRATRQLASSARCRGGTDAFG